VVMSKRDKEILSNKEFSKPISDELEREIRLNDAILAAIDKSRITFSHTFGVLQGIMNFMQLRVYGLSSKTVSEQFSKINQDTEDPKTHG